MIDGDPIDRTTKLLLRQRFLLTNPRFYLLNVSLRKDLILHSLFQNHKFRTHNIDSGCDSLFFFFLDEDAVPPPVSVEEAEVLSVLRDKPFSFYLL